VTGVVLYALVRLRARHTPARIARQIKEITEGSATMKNVLASTTLAISLLFANQSYAGDDPKVAAEIMALARAQWAAEVAGQSAAEQMTSAADDYTEFNADYPTRIDGKALNTRMWEAFMSDGSKPLVADMVNPKVQVYGDTAILTYNFVGVGRDKDGKVSANAAKSTRVYSKIGGRWLLVHANFAPAASKY
jgi:ketosteroid isomerase-like protein